MQGDARTEIPELITAGRGKRLLVIAGVVVAVVIVAVVIGWLVWKRRQDARAREVGRAWDTFERCMIGGPPGPGQTPGDLLRRIELRFRHMPETTDPARRGAGWPGRCEPYARAIYEGLKRVDLPGKQAGEKLGLMAYGVVGVIKAGNAPTNADEIWATARAAGVPRVRGPRINEPAAPVEAVLKKGQLRPLGADVTTMWQTPAAGAEHLLLERRGAAGASERLLCTVAATGPARCRLVPRGLLASADSVETVSRMLQVPDSDDAPPALVNLAEAGVDTGLYAYAGKQRVWANPGWQLRGGWVRGQSFGLFAETPRGWRLVTQLGTGAPAESALPEPLALAEVGEWLLTVEKGDRVVARRLASTAAPVEVAVLPPPAPAGVLTTDGADADDDVVAADEDQAGGWVDVATWRFGERCRSAEAALAVLSRGGQRWLLVGGAAGWKATELAGDLPGNHRPAVCRGQSMELLATSWDEGVQWIERHSCSASGCVKEAAKQAVGEADLGQAGELVLMAWEGDNDRLGDRGAIWLRLARAPELETTPDVLLVDSAAHGGISALLRAVHSLGDVALLLLEDATDDQSYLVRVRGDGAIEPVAVEMVP